MRSIHYIIVKAPEKRKRAETATNHYGKRHNIIMNCFAKFVTAAIAAAVLMISSCGVRAYAGELDFTSEITPCTPGKSDGSVHITITGGNDSKEYYISHNGGKSFVKSESRKIALNGFPEGSANVCIKDSSGNVSPVTVCYIPEKGKKYPLMISAESYPEKLFKDGSVKVHINNYDKEKDYQLSVNGGQSWFDTSSPCINLTSVSSGIITVCVREKDSGKTSPTLNVTVAPPSHKKKCYIKTDFILQNPELPTGCEITSLTMLLNHLGFKADKLDLADNYLPKGEYANSNFYEVFVGNPRDVHAFGCFSVPIEKAAKSYLKAHDKEKKWKVVNLTGCSPDTLYAAIDAGDPVVVWASIRMRNIVSGRSWRIKETGELLVWPAREHCLLLTGYDTEKNLAYFNDPLIGQVAYSKDTFEAVFKSLDCNALIIVPA